MSQYRFEFGIDDIRYEAIYGHDYVTGYFLIVEDLETGDFVINVSQYIPDLDSYQDIMTYGIAETYFDGIALSWFLQQFPDQDTRWHEYCATTNPRPEMYHVGYLTKNSSIPIVIEKTELPKFITITGITLRDAPV